MWEVLGYVSEAGVSPLMFFYILFLIIISMCQKKLTDIKVHITAVDK